MDDPAARLAVVPDKGHGFLATRDISRGERILTDCPILLAPLAPNHMLCEACLRPCTPAPPSLPRDALRLSPGTFSERPVMCQSGCGAHFCGESCRARVSDTHVLLCAAGSPPVRMQLNLALATRLAICNDGPQFFLGWCREDLTRTRAQMKELEGLKLWEAPRLRLFAFSFALILASFQVAPSSSTSHTTLSALRQPNRTPLGCGICAMHACA